MKNYLNAGQGSFIFFIGQPGFQIGQAANKEIMTLCEVEIYHLSIQSPFNLAQGKCNSKLYIESSNECCTKVSLYWKEQWEDIENFMHYEFQPPRNLHASKYLEDHIKSVTGQENLELGFSDFRYNYPLVMSCQLITSKEQNDCSNDFRAIPSMSGMSFSLNSRVEEIISNSTINRLYYEKVGLFQETKVTSKSGYFNLNLVLHPQHGSVEFRILKNK